MLDILKKTLLVGIGATITTKEKIEAALGSLVEKGKISSADAKEIADKIAEDGKKEFDDAGKNIDAAFENLLHKAKVVTKGQLAELEARVAKLESRDASEKEECCEEGSCCCKSEED